jgi:DNA polymerase III gamma/tau subunit
VETVLGLVDSQVMIELAQAIAQGNSSAVLSIVNRISEYGIDYKVFYNELLAFYRDLFRIRFSDQPEEQSDSRLQELSAEYEETHLLRICHQLVSMQNLLRLSGNLRFLFEITLVKLAHIKRLIPLEELAENLKKNVSLPTAPAATASNPRTVVETSPRVPASIGSPGSMGDDFFALLISELEGQNPRLAAALENATFRQSNSKISFFVPEVPFRMMKLDAKDQLDLQAVLQNKLGVQVQVEIHGGEPPDEPGVNKVATPETLVQSDPVVQEFVKVFRGKISKIELSNVRTNHGDAETQRR